MTIKHRNGQYEVEFLGKAKLLEILAGQPILTDENVARELRLSGDNVLVLAPGETEKHLGTYTQCIDWLMSRSTTRSTTVYSVGGGVVGDLGGFVASTYMRGIQFVQVPTTLLSMVDSSVGGKVGIDHGDGKNIIGAFYPPSQVLICSELLLTVPPRQIRSGLAEVLKYGFIADPSILINHEVNEDTIRRCIEIKARIVEMDEFETTGLRATLNFGHTVGHALESATGFAELTHGEAISVGMAVEAKLSEIIGLAPAETFDRVQSVLSAAGLPTSHELLKNPTTLIDRMMLDKKRTTTGLAFSLLTEIGMCKLQSEVSPKSVVEACLKS